jgi:ribosome-binding ATPase YchF (GTP1/OBG family)
VANVDEKTLTDPNFQLNINEQNILPVCAKIEQELSQLDLPERQEYLNSLGLKQSGLERIIKEAYHTLGLQSYYTAGVKEVRAWTIKQGSLAPEAAGAIHTDFVKGFIAAEVISYPDYVQYQGAPGAKAAGKMRLEGKSYLMRPDDVVEFKINA